MEKSLDSVEEIDKRVRAVYYDLPGESIICVRPAEDKLLTLPNAGISEDDLVELVVTGLITVVNHGVDPRKILPLASAIFREKVDENLTKLKEQPGDHA